MMLCQDSGGNLGAAYARPRRLMTYGKPDRQRLQALGAAEARQLGRLGGRETARTRSVAPNRDG
jgi:hypothetical protein